MTRQSDPPVMESPLFEVKEWLEEQLDNGGAECPCCGQYARRYRRKLNSNMAASLIKAWCVAGDEWFHAPTVLGRNDGELAKLRYWGLVEEERRARPDGGRAGWWRVTPQGKIYVKGHTSVPAHALIYDGQLLRLDASSGRVTIHDALGDKFSYRELMGEKVEM